MGLFATQFVIDSGVAWYSHPQPAASSPVLLIAVAVKRVSVPASYGSISSSRWLCAVSVLPSVVPLLGDDGRVVALVKPQFEVGKGQVGSGGIVRDEAQRRSVTEKVISCGATLGLEATGVLDSPIRGRKGNQEILVGFRRQGIIRPSERQ